MESENKNKNRGGKERENAVKNKLLNSIFVGFKP